MRTRRRHVCNPDNEFSGHVTIFFYDLDGKLLLQTAAADLKDRRITVD